ncbi:hypothetical protein LINPERPRIM_LOCUS11170, partial [Linum perenne]
MFDFLLSQLIFTLRMLPLVMMTFTFPSLACYHHPSIGFPVYFFTLSLFDYYIEFSNIQ